MSTSKFTLSHKPYSPKNGDYVCLLWLDGKTPCFSKKQLPKRHASIKPPSGIGGVQTVHVGASMGQHIGITVFRLDAEDSSPSREIKKITADAITEARKLKLKRVVVLLDGRDTQLCKGVQEGAVLGGYCFDSYLSKKKKPLPVQLLVEKDHYSSLKGQLHKDQLVARCVNFARDTLNGPPCAVNPQTLARLYSEFGKEQGLKISVWDEKRLATENCGGILAVGQGSSVKPCLVIGEYSPSNAQCHLALVGKGITFDSGGYCLKPAKGQEEMKLDMGGAAMMFSAAAGIAALGLPLRVSVFAPLAHNAVSSTAYNVSDIISTRSGQTVEVENTDAEGRIIMADALTLACERKPDYLIDSATLTGAAVVALGEDISAVYGTDQDLVRKFIEAADRVDEDMWPMPLHQPYKKQLESPIADMKNSGDRYGGSITAALFLMKFVTDVARWIHLDIAGPGCKLSPLGHLGKGAKGHGVKTIVEFAERLSLSQ